MNNPFRSEGEAFKFLWLVIGYCVLIVGAWYIDKWLGLAVFVVLTGLAAWWILLRGRREPPVKHAPAPSPPDEHRILVVANETVGGPELLAVVRERATAAAVVHVVCPALNSPLKTITSDDDAARVEAQRRLDASLASMRDSGLDVTGEVGDGDPVQAIEDAMRTFRPDELILSTHPEGRSKWLERGVVARATERFELPLTHVVVDLDADRA